MTMAIAQPDPFSNTSRSPVEELTQAALGVSLNRSNSSLGNIGSSSSSTSPENAGEPKEAEDSPILTLLLPNRDVFSIFLWYLDTRSLLFLSSTNQRLHREILTPVIPSHCCLNIFLQQRIVVCPMAQFESLKDFMVKYRSFRPHHLHFTYSERSSLMSLVPEVTAPIYNSKQDLTFTHPASSPLSTSHLHGVNQSISIGITSANSLYQHHHPLTMEQQQQSSMQAALQRHLQHTQHENDQPETTSSHVNNSNFANTNFTISQHAAVERVKTIRTNSSSSSSTDSAISDNCESSGEDRGRKFISEIESVDGENKSPISDLDSKVAALTIPSINAPDPSSPQEQHQHLQYQQQQQHHQQQQYYRQHQPSHSVDYREINGIGGSGSGTSYNHESSNLHNHYHQHRLNGGPLDHHVALSEPILAHPSSSASNSPPLSAHGHHGFELSYWQKFALNELFMRILPFLKTITIGRTDKPSKRARIRDPAIASGELSAGVCFFLARCFNVMHDMPDTALESVVWMDVTPKDVALLVTMIELRDIMVDGRYWKRGYWATERLSARGGAGSDEDSDDQKFDDSEDDGDDWDGFYYLINQEEEDKKTIPQPPRKTTSPSPRPSSGKAPQRKSSSIRGSKKSSSASSTPTTSSFPKQSTTPLPSQQQVSGLDSLAKDASSFTTSSSNSAAESAFSYSTASYSTASSSHQSSYATKAANNRYYRNNIAPPPAPWQGFGDGVTDMNSASATASPFPEDQLHPAVIMYEAMKAEIVDAALISRTLGKGKHTATTVDLVDPWEREDTTTTEKY
ncbi:hypothetical protein BGX27_000724 [Mortierella sp. AM989]|nr:hypothetical protein BGX27_000724 [Mortierella sp. AM989]